MKGWLEGMSDEMAQAREIEHAEPGDKALEWLRNYHGSIDSTALLLAYRAGRSEALEEAARETCDHCQKGIKADPAGRHYVNDGGQPRGQSGRWVPCHGKHIRALRDSQPVG